MPSPPPTAIRTEPPTAVGSPTSIMEPSPPRGEDGGVEEFGSDDLLAALTGGQLAQSILAKLVSLAEHVYVQGIDEAIPPALVNLAEEPSAIAKPSADAAA